MKLRLRLLPALVAAAALIALSLTAQALPLRWLHGLPSRLMVNL